MITERSERIAAGPAEALAGLLGVDVPDLETTGIPLLWHWVYLLDRPTQQELGPDGHPLVGIPAPPEPGRRRMFAGGAVVRHRPLRVDVETIRRTAVVSTVEKVGRAGPMTITTVEHTLFQHDDLIVTDRQDIAYLTAAPVVPQTEQTEVGRQKNCCSLTVDPVMLFRFSALTYNAHRIHYDVDYARDVEGHPGLVVHGPLQAIAMATAAAVPAAGVDEFRYRLVAPLYVSDGLHIQVDRRSAATAITTVSDDLGRLTATGTWRSTES